MSSTSPAAPASFDLETVEVWYTCRSEKCSRLFYSIPALQKHFSENHPDEELTLPNNLAPGALEGRILFQENFSKKLPGYHKNCKKFKTAEAPAPSPVQSPEAATHVPVKKKNCDFCSRSFSSQGVLNFHLKKEHGHHCASASDVGMETVTSTDEETPQGRQLIGLNNTVPSTTQGRSQSMVIKRKPWSWSPLKLPSAQLRPFRCDRCSKAFCTSDSLKIHLSTHSDNGFKCSVCGVTTRWKNSLVRHMKRVHKLSSDVANAKPEGNEVRTSQKNRLIKVRAVPKPRLSRRVILSCNDCPYKTKFAVRFENHCKLHEVGANAAECHICGWYLRPMCVGLHQKACHPETVKVADK